MTTEEVETKNIIELDKSVDKRKMTDLVAMNEWFEWGRRPSIRQFYSDSFRSVAHSRFGIVGIFDFGTSLAPFILFFPMAPINSRSA